VLVNADAFDLLNAYMTDEELRREIVERQDEILGEAGADPAGVGGTSQRAEMLGLRADSTLARAQSQVAALAGSPLLDESGRDAVVGLAESLAAVRTDAQAATQAGREVESAVAATRSIAAGLTKAFPIGWDGYPNCKPGTADLRCVRLIERMPTGIDHDTSLVTVSRAVAMVDTAAFAKSL